MKKFNVFTKENQQPQPTTAQKFVMNLANTASVAASVVTLYSSIKFIKNELIGSNAATTAETPAETPETTETKIYSSTEAIEKEKPFEFISNDEVLSMLMTNKMVIFDHHDDHDDPIFKVYRRNLYFRFSDECTFVFYQKKKESEDFFKSATARFNRFDGALSSIKIDEPAEEFNEFLIELVKILNALKK